MRSLCKVLGIFVVFLVGVSSRLLAEDVDLERIVVTPSRVEESFDDISRKVDIITAEDIEFSQAKDLAQLLDEKASINISNYGSLGATKTIRMRGSSGAQVLLLMDSRPINNPRDGNAQLSDISLENIERIEVMYGPASSMYGAGAMGGTINIITKAPPREKARTEITTSFGGFRTFIERVSHGQAFSKLGYIVTGEYRGSEGPRDNSDFHARDLSSKIEYNLDDYNKLSLNAGLHRSTAGAPGKVTQPDTDDKQRKRNNFLDLKWDFKSDDASSSSARVYQNYDRLEFSENATAISFGDIAFNKDIHATKVRGVEVQLKKELFENYRGICGFNYVENINDSTNTAKHEYVVRAGYLENRIDLSENLNINFGARIDDYSSFGTELNPSVSFLYNLSQESRLYGSLSRSFRAPTFNDLYADLGWGVGNPDLKPEEGISGELGIDMNVNRYLFSSLIYYRNDYDSLINWAEQGGVWRPSNVDSALIDGVEFENKIYLTDRLDLVSTYSFLRAKDDKQDKYLNYHPKHKLDCSLKYNNPNGLMFGLKGQFTDKRFHDAANTIKVKKFFTFGLNISKKTAKGTTYFISVDNLLNRKYEVIREYPVSGFNVTTGMKLEF